MKKIFPLFFLALTACEGPNNIRGDLALKRPTTIQTPGGSVVNLSPARYPTTVRMEANGATVFINTNQGSVSFAAPGLLADSGGRINIPASRLGQTFGLQGEIITRSTSFDRVVEVYCVYDRRPECRPLPNGGCQWEEREIPGRQRYREIGVAQVKFVQLNLVAGGRSSGQFNGSYPLGESLESREPIGWCERW